MCKPQTGALSALSHVQGVHFNQCWFHRGGCGSSLSQSITKMLERQTANIPQSMSMRDMRCPSHPLIRGSSTRIKALCPFCFWRCERSTIWSRECIVEAQRSHLMRPTGFHIKSPAFVQKCICSLILFGSCVKQKRTNGRKNHSLSLSSSSPFPLPPLSLFLHLSVPFSLSLLHILLEMLMIPSPPLYSDARSVYTFPFHPHTNVLLLPLRPRAF